ncbi:MAG: DUF6165 family protein [Isosphaeraceae bacterium]|nr:DUF6165 family protein [Isosphaeraceae bacterium]
MPTLQETVAEGRRRHQAGELPAAERLYRAALQAAPEDPEALYLLGTVCSAQGNMGEAEACYRKVIQLRPHVAEAHNSLGILYARQERREDALRCFEGAVRAKPDFSHAHNNLANVLKELGRSSEAEARYREALRLQPGYAEAHCNLGSLLRDRKLYTESEAECRRAVQLKPDYADAHCNLGGALAGLERHEEAVGCFRQAIRLNPVLAEAHNNLGASLSELQRYDDALVPLRQALKLKPDYVQAWRNLANVLRELGRFDEALEAIDRSLELDVREAESHSSRGLVLSELGRQHECIECYHRAVELDPKHVQAVRNRSLVRLLLGDLERGFAEFELRWGGKGLPVRPFAQPLWDGSPLGGRRILIHAEQGIGDTLQFVRFLPLVKARGGTVILACQKSLLNLLAGAAGIDELVAQADKVADLPPFDVHAPLMSLPHIFGTALETIPAEVPYLHADPVLLDKWGEAIRAQPGFKIGIAWQGSVKYRRDRLRSLPLERFAPLAELPGVQLVNLQQGTGREQLAHFTRRHQVVDFGDQVDREAGPFMDTAAIVKHLDLVVASDSAIVHLAGALGATVFMPTQLVPDWRWLLDREESPWYPSLRLFRQTRAGDWEGVFERIAQTIRDRLGVTRPVLVEIAPGELLDKLTILDIKAARIADAAKLKNVETERTVLSAARERAIPALPDLDPLIAELRAVNEALWDIEDEIRLCEQRSDFGDRFVALARSVYQRNDRRAAIKRAINERLGSRIVEEKAFTATGSEP